MWRMNRQKARSRKKHIYTLCSSMYIRSVRIYRVKKKININTEIAQEYARAKKLIEIS